MTKSHIVQIQGNFVGAAMAHPEGYRFVALDVRLDELDGLVWATFPELHRQVQREYEMSRLGTAKAAFPPC